MLRKSKFSILNKYIIKSILLAITLVLCKSCYRDPININLEEFANKIVIEGNITGQEGTTVRISRTVDYNEEGDFPPVQDARVVIEDQNGESQYLTEIQPGIYQDFSFRGNPGNTYTLKVLINYDLYTASSTMPQPLTIQSMDFTRIAPGADYYHLSFSFLDHAGIDNYCIIKLYYNGYLADQYLYNDKQHDGELISVDYFDKIFYLNDLVTLELQTIDKSIYDYFHTLNIIEEREAEDDEIAGTFLPVTTYNPTTNLNNGALGYFSANIIERYSRRVY